MQGDKSKPGPPEPPRDGAVAHQEATSPVVEVVAPLIADLTPEQQTEILQTVEEYTHYEGVLPPPQMMRQYGEIRKDIPNRLVEMVEKQTAHRQKLEEAMVNAQVERIKAENSQVINEDSRADRGQWMALTIGLALIAVGTWVTMSGHDTTGNIIFGTGAATMVGIFITGQVMRRGSNKKETAQEADEPLPVPKSPEPAHPAPARRNNKSQQRKKK